MKRGCILILANLKTYEKPGLPFTIGMRYIFGFFFREGSTYGYYHHQRKDPFRVVNGAYF
jgi:hypothetical protein